jgi:hypothetical protein
MTSSSPSFGQPVKARGMRRAGSYHIQLPARTAFKAITAMLPCNPHSENAIP